MSSEQQNKSDQQQKNSNELKADNTENQQQSQKNGDAASEKEGSPINLALVGGLVGAGAGLLAKPETGKRLLTSLGESELVKVAGQEFRKTAQELLAGQAQESFKHMATGYIDKLSNSFSNIGSGKSNSNEADSSQYDEIKQENEALHDRLDRIESMIDKLASSK